MLAREKATPRATRLLCAVLVLMSVGLAPAAAQTESPDALNAVVVAHHDEEWQDGPDDRSGVTYSEDDDDDGDWSDGRRVNRVVLKNRKDGRLRVRGNIQLNHFAGPNVEPINFSYAYSSCVDCQTITVALQINLMQRGAPRVVPQNVAIALNDSCTDCRTVAHAIQYVISVDDPYQMPENVNRLIWRMDRELQEVHASKDIGLEEAEARVDSVIAEFNELALGLTRQRDETTAPTSPSVAPPPTPGSLPQPAVTPTATTEPLVVPQQTPSLIESTPLPAPTSEPSITPLDSTEPTPVPTTPSPPTT